MSAFVQCQTVQSGGAQTLTKAITTTEGNSVIVALVYTFPKTVVNQTSGDPTFATPAELNDGGTGFYVGYRVANNVVGGATTYTFASTGGVNAMMFLVETTPLHPTPVDVFATEASSAATTHLVGPTGALIDPTEFALAVWNAGGSATNTPSVDTGFTIPTNGNAMGAGITDCRACLAYLDCTTAPSVTLTSTASITAFGVLAALRLAPPLMRNPVAPLLRAFNIGR
jgi:hypothetical protein